MPSVYFWMLSCLCQRDKALFRKGLFIRRRTAEVTLVSSILYFRVKTAGLWVGSLVHGFWWTEMRWGQQWWFNKGPIQPAPVQRAFLFCLTLACSLWLCDLWNIIIYHSRNISLSKLHHMWPIEKQWEFQWGSITEQDPMGPPGNRPPDQVVCLPLVCRKPLAS